MATEQLYAENEVLELSSVEEAELIELANGVETQANDDDQCHGPLVAGGAGIKLTNLAGRMKNSTPKGALTLLHKKVWEEGKFITGPSRSINKSGTGTFIQNNYMGGACKGAVVYVGHNQHNKECGWLFAFLNARGSQRKVYAQCGPKNKFNNVNWNDIEAKLDRSRSSISVTDRATGTKVSAQMFGTTGQSITTASFK